MGCPGTILGKEANKFAQFLSFRDKYTFWEVLAAQLAHECEPRGGEEHFLAYGCGVEYLGYCDEGFIGGGERVRAAE